MQQPTFPHQHQLSELAPGSPGGRALRERRGVGYFAEIGSRGGRRTVSTYGLLHMRSLAAAGGREKRRRLYSWPRTVRPWYGGLERRVPYGPPKSTKRRKRPVFVRIELEVQYEQV